MMSVRPMRMAVSKLFRGRRTGGVGGWRNTRSFRIDQPLLDQDDRGHVYVAGVPLRGPTV